MANRDPLAEDNSITGVVNDGASVYTGLDGKSVALGAVTVKQCLEWAAQEYETTIVSASERWFNVGMLVVRAARIAGAVIKEYLPRDFRNHCLEVQNRVREVTGAALEDIRVAECVYAYLLREALSTDGEFGSDSARFTYLEFVALSSRRASKGGKPRCLAVQLHGMLGTFRDEYRGLVRDLLATRMDGYTDANPRGKLTIESFKKSLADWDAAQDALALPGKPAPTEAEIAFEKLKSAGAEKAARSVAIRNSIMESIVKDGTPSKTIADELLGLCETLKVPSFTVASGVNPSTMTKAEALQFVAALKQRVKDEFTTKPAGDSAVTVMVALRDELSKVIDPILAKRAERKAMNQPAPELAQVA